MYIKDYENQITEPDSSVQIQGNCRRAQTAFTVKSKLQRGVKNS